MPLVVWSAAYNWFLVVLQFRLQAYIQHGHTQPCQAHSTQQLPGIDFFPPSFFCLCLVEASSCSVLFFPLTISVKAVRQQSTDSTDRKSIQSHPSLRSLSSYLDISPARGGGRTQVCLFDAHIQKSSTVSSLLSEVYPTISNPGKVHQDGWLFFLSFLFC